MRDMGAGFIQSRPDMRLCGLTPLGRKTSIPKLRRQACEAPSTNLTENASYEGGLHRSAGYDAGKKIKGKKRHRLVDTLGLLLHAIVHPAGIQDRDGGVLLLATLFGRYPFLKSCLPTVAIRGQNSRNALAKILPHLKTEIVKRSGQAKGFVVLPKRWIVERTVAWLNRCRRLAKDWENLNRKALAFLHLASFRLMLRKL
jgi:transposase